MSTITAARPTNVADSATTDQPTIYRIDGKRAQASFTIGERLFSIIPVTVRGTFDRLNGTIVLDPRDPARSHVRLTIAADSVATGSPRRDKHLRTADFFDVARFPEIGFISTAIGVDDPAAGRFRVTGDLTILGQTHVETIDTTLLVGPSGPRFTATATIDRRRYGVRWSNALVAIAPKVRVTVELGTMLA